MTSKLRVLKNLNNLGFNPVEFDGIKSQAGLGDFTLTPMQLKEQYEHSSKLEMEIKKNLAGLGFNV